MKIGIMGAPIDSGNMGCMALTYSLLSCLEAVGKAENLDLSYKVFDWKYNEKKLQMLSEKLNIPKEKIEYGHYSSLNHPLKIAYHSVRTVKMIQDIRKCDCVIDLTEGDSFSDIYGDEWFRGRTKVKLLVSKQKKPLLLGPQTYGPFLKKDNYELAKEAILAADFVMTRDNQSIETINKMGRTDAVNTSDLAFSLPYNKRERAVSEKLKIGINASRLLMDDTEMNCKNFSLSLDYQQYLFELIEYLLNSKKYEVYLISHVSGDYAVHEMIHQKYPETTLVPVFDNPIDAKNFITETDVFIGARMHGTIAAYSSGVPCIATAYSPKFKNLFIGLDYHYMIDLTSLDNKTAFARTAEYIQNYKDMAEAEKAGQYKAEQYRDATKKTLSSWLTRLRSGTENRL